jgi:hypothetical protein
LYFFATSSSSSGLIELAWLAAVMEHPIMPNMLTPSIGLTKGEKITLDLNIIMKLVVII